MTDEEKKEYEELKNLLYTGTISQYGKRKLIDIIEKQEKKIQDFKWKENQQKDLLKYKTDKIEKQSKEIEELKEKHKPQPDCAEPIERIEEMVNMKWVNYNYISKDKIKAKIEEYENKIKKIRNKKVINEPEDTIIITRYAHYISVLQSLLEKE